MTRWAYVQLLWLSACSFVNDFDQYRYDLDAAHEESDRRGKPPRPLDAGEDAPPSEEGSPAADAEPDGQAVAPEPDGSQGAPEGGSDAGPRDTGPAQAQGLAGEWLVRLPLLSSSCSPRPADVELGSWEVSAAAGGAAVLRTSAFTLAGTLQRAGGEIVAASFGGDVDVAHVTLELQLEPDGTLGGLYVLEPLGAGRCVTSRSVEGVR